MAMVPHNKALVKRMKERPFALVGVNADDDLDEANEVIKNKTITWRSFKRTQGKDAQDLTDLWMIEAFPARTILSRPAGERCPFRRVNRRNV